MNKPHLPLLLAIFAITVMSGCNLRPTNEAENSQLVTQQVSVDDLLQRQYIVPLLKDKHITLVDTSTGESVDVYEFNNNEIPNLFKLHDIKLTKNRKHLVWYSPQSGLLSYSFDTKETSLLINANQWLNNNPYFEIHPQDDIAYIIDNEGTEFYEIKLDTLEARLVPIPFPFGNAFKVSPDLSHILFISGFGQTEVDPEFMFTTIEGENPVRFTTKTPLNRREEVVWLPDSSGILLLSENADSIDKISRDQTNPQEYYKPLQEQIIMRFEQVNNLLYFQTTDDWWHVIDMNIEEEIASMPKEVVADIHRPYFLPWKDETFLIEETISLNSQQFNRLWKTDFTGTKKLLVDSYNEITISNSLIDL